MKMPQQIDEALSGLRIRALRLQRQFDGRVARERQIIIGGALVVIAWAADPLCITPAFKAWKEQHSLAQGMQQTVLQVRQARVDRETQSRALEQQLVQDLATWRRRVQESDQSAHQVGGDLVAAGDMVSVLRGVLDQTSGLRLRSLQSVPRTEIATAVPAAPASAASTVAVAAAPDVGRLYRQGVDLEVEGSYEALLAYCQALEALPQHVLWGGMHLKADRHPRLVMTLRLYTLSPDRNWLVI
jgi:MSHA biogenesis protein MshJ